MKVVNSGGELAKAMESGEVIVDFYADWCGPCRAITGHLEEIDKTIPVIKVNIDKLPNVAALYEVRSIPTLLKVSDGKEVARVVGGRSKPDLIKELGLNDR